MAAKNSVREELSLSYFRLANIKAVPLRSHPILMAYWFGGQPGPRKTSGVGSPLPTITSRNEKYQPTNGPVRNPKHHASNKHVQIGRPRAITKQESKPEWNEPDKPLAAAAHDYFFSSITR